MPFRKKEKKTKAHKTMRRRTINRGNRNTKLAIPRNLIDGKSKGDFGMINKKCPFKPSMAVVLQYADNVILTAGASGLYGTEFVLRLNSLYDPEFAGPGTNHQPYGYDQMALLYRKYIVHAVDIQAEYTDPTEDGLIVAASLQAGNGTFTLTGQSNNELKEKPSCVTRCINNSGSQTGVIKHFTHLHKLEGIHKVQWLSNLSEYSATTGTNPTISPYFRIALASARNTSGATIMFRPKIKFYCTFFERIVLEQS